MRSHRRRPRRDLILPLQYLRMSLFPYIKLYICNTGAWSSSYHLEDDRQRRIAISGIDGIYLIDG